MSIINKTEAIKKKIISFYCKLEDSLHVKYNTVVWISILVSCFLVVLFSAIMRPYSSDDFIYRYIYPASGSIEKISEISTPISSIYDIVVSQTNHYNLWGGRVVSHSMVQFLLWAGKPTSSIIQAITFVLLVFVICKLAYGSKKISKTSFILCASLIYLLNASFDETCIWVTGFGNYMFSALITLAFILPYKLYIEREPASKTSLSAFFAGFFMFVFGILAGWGNENISVALLLLIIYFIVNYKLRKKSVPIWGITGFAGAFIGSCFLIFAPGNAVRAESIEINGALDFLKTIVVRTYYIERAVSNYLFGAIVILIFLTVITTSFCKKQLSRSGNVLILAGFLSILVMAASPTFPPRATFGSLCLLTVGIIENVKVLDLPQFKRILPPLSFTLYMGFILQLTTQALYTVFK